MSSSPGGDLGDSPVADGIVTVVYWFPVELMHSGKVRDVYADGDDLILVASDRVSVYDVVLPTPIPDKGAILTRLSLWWFEQLADVVPNHVISGTDVPAEFAGRAIRCRRLAIVPVECVARGYLAGSGLAAYRESGAVCGVPLPGGLLDGSQLPGPVFTPTTKAPVGTHDEPLTYAEVVAQVGADVAAELRRITLAVYQRGAALAAERGIIVADTKIELGRAADGGLVLADELLTPDSSRFWPADLWQPGKPQFSFDKQYLRDWAAGTGWDRQSAPPEVPAEVVEATRARYVEAWERLTGQPW
jgi:phosphoribosylaminoimidazole-succinocarboxamide synthase